MNPAIDLLQLQDFLTERFSELSPGEYLGFRFLPKDKKIHKILSGIFDNREAALKTIIDYAGIYHINAALNPLKKVPTLMVNAVAAGRSFGDSDVTRLLRLCIDVDPKRKKGTASNPVELNLARQVTNNVEQELNSKKIPFDFGISGNGFHLFVSLPAYSTKESEKIANLLNYFDQKFSTDGAEIDTSMGNPSKICRIPGTLNLKGENTPGRPHRMAKILKKSEPLKKICDILKLYPMEVEKTFIQNSPPQFLKPQDPTKKYDYSKFKGDIKTLDLVGLSQEMRIYVKRIDENKHIINCPNSAEHSDDTDGTSSTIIYGGGFPPSVGFKCQHNHCTHIDLPFFLNNYCTPEQVDKYCAREFLNYVSAEKQLKKKDGGYQFAILDDFLNEPESPHDYVVDNLLLVGGFSLLASQPKVGKTTLLRYLAIAVAKGSEFLGLKTLKGPVLYLGLEEHKGQLRKEFKKLRPDPGLALHIHAAPAPIEKTIEGLAESIENIKPNLVIIDTMHKFVRFKDGNSYAEVNAALEPVLNLARKYECHILCSHHLSKNNTVDNGRQILGSTAIHGAFDALLYLQKKENSRIMEVDYRYSPAIPFEPSILTLDPFTAGIVATPVAKQKEVTLEAAILELFNENAVLTKNEIVDLIGGRKNDVIHSIKVLVIKDKLIKNGIGKKGNPEMYSVPPPALG